jgi:hypothetical protein
VNADDADEVTEHRLVGPACACGEWEARLGESIRRGFDLHLVEVLHSGR